MMALNMNTDCPCGSGFALEACCLPYLQGQSNAPSAEALMRSRYTAHTRVDIPYLIATCHTSLQPSQDAKGIESWCNGVIFVKLEVLETKAGLPQDTSGTVRFRAWFVENGKMKGLQERSRFEREQGKWTYHSGQHNRNTVPSPNDACPCGSGSKYKKCHGA
jgi:SEC-C motif domain protein